MRLNLKKVSAIGASALLAGMSMGVAAAAPYPAPFVVGGVGDVAIVHGAGASLDVAPSFSLNTDLETYATGGSGGSVATGGDSLLLAKSSDNLNLGDTWGTFTGTVDEDDLATLLADGTYVAGDNDEFDYEQKIVLGTPKYTHFRDSDYEDIAGLDTKTPVLGFKLSSNTHVLNYTIDFTQDAESDISGGDLEDIEGSDLMLLGKNYYVSDLDNGTSSAYIGKLTLLDSATTGTVGEGETVTITSGGNSYTVSMSYIDSNEVKYLVNGVEVPTSGKLQEGNSAKLADGAYIGVRDISKLEVAGETGSSSFSIGSGKLEMTSGSDIKLNDDAVDGVVGYVHRGTDGSTTTTIDKIVIKWTTDEEVFLSPLVDLTMPGFGAVKFTMADYVRPAEEKLTVDPDGDTSIEMTIPIKDGTVSFNILWSNSTGEFLGIGKSATERLATSNTSVITFYEKEGSSGADYHDWFVASYAATQEAESYVLRAKVREDSTDDRNETTIQKLTPSGWSTVCEDKINGTSCDIGDVSMTIMKIYQISGKDEYVILEGASGVEFDTIYTAGGLKVHLPFEAPTNFSVGGAINFTCYHSDNPGDKCNFAGHSIFDGLYLFMESEDREDNLGSGAGLTMTIDETSDDKLHVEALNTTGSGKGGAGSGTGGPFGLEVGTGSNTYESYALGYNNESAPRIMHYTNPDEDWAEVYYPTGESETYAQVYLAEAGVTVSGEGGGDLGTIVFKDTESASYADKNVIVVGGSCVNSAAASLLGVASGTCGADWEASTGVGSGQFLIQSFSGSTVTSKVALLVAGWEAQDTVNAATYLINEKPDTASGNKYVGSTATSAELVVD